MPRRIKISEDEQLPQLGVALDASAMQEVLKHHFPEFASGPWQIYGMIVKAFQHRRGRKCEVIYGLYFKNAATSELHRQTLSATMLPKGAAEAQFAAERQHPHFQPPIGVAVHLIPQLEMILWGFPNDPRLRRLPELVDPAPLEEILRQNWASLQVPRNHHLAGVDTEVVKYVPQDRCTLKHTLRLQNASHTDELVVFSKTYSDKTDGEPIFGVVRDLWNAPVCQSGALAIPEPLFFNRGLNVIFQRGLAGQNMDEIGILSRIDLEAAMEKIGVALAGIHQSAVPASSFRSLQKEIYEVAEGMEALCKFNPAYQTRLEAINDELWQRLPALTSLDPVPIHGAFRLSQLLIAGDKIGLVDFDGFLQGDPIVDVGSFVAHLLYLVVKGDLTEEQSRAAIRRFCRAYAGAAPWGLPDDLLHWCVPVMLISKQAKKCIRLAKDNHAAKVEQLVNWAGAILEGKLLLA
jgi:hypothetical protein